MGWRSRGPHGRQIWRLEIGRPRLARPRAPVLAARPQVTWSPKKPSPYPPATGVGAPRAARAPRSHCQLRAVEAGVDSEEEGTELQPRGHSRTLAQRGPSPLGCRLQLAPSPWWPVAAAAAGGRPHRACAAGLRPASLLQVPPSISVLPPGPAPLPRPSCLDPAPQPLRLGLQQVSTPSPRELFFLIQRICPNDDCSIQKLGATQRI